MSPQGWLCPGCQRCYAPWAYRCTECGPVETTITASTEAKRCTAQRTDVPSAQCVLFFPHVGLPHRWSSI